MPKKGNSTQESSLGKNTFLAGDLPQLFNKTKQHRAKLAAELSSTDQFLESIQNFARISGVQLETGPVTPPLGLPRKAVAAAAPASPPAPQPARRKRQNGSPIPQAVRAAIAAQTEPWNYVNIRAYLDEHYPALSKQISGARLSQELYTARKGGLAKVHHKGPVGGSHSYVTMPQAV